MWPNSTLCLLANIARGDFQYLAVSCSNDIIAVGRQLAV
jgi:hypothetical protein